jgi:hypothetical protein
MYHSLSDHYQEMKALWEERQACCKESRKTLLEVIAGRKELYHKTADQAAWCLGALDKCQQQRAWWRIF